MFLKIHTIQLQSEMCVDSDFSFVSRATSMMTIDQERLEILQNKMSWLKNPFRTFCLHMSVCMLLKTDLLATLAHTLVRYGATLSIYYSARATIINNEHLLPAEKEQNKLKILFWMVMLIQSILLITLMSLCPQHSLIKVRPSDMEVLRRRKDVKDFL